MNHDRTMCVTGETGKRPRVFIWSTDYAEKVSKVKLGRVRGVKTIAWSKSGKYVACTCLDDKHSVYLINPKSGKAKIMC